MNVVANTSHDFVSEIDQSVRYLESDDAQRSVEADP